MKNKIDEYAAPRTETPQQAIQPLQEVLPAQPRPDESLFQESGVARLASSEDHSLLAKSLRDQPVPDQGRATYAENKLITFIFTRAK